MRLPLKTRVEATREPPTEIIAGSVINKVWYDDDRALRYIYLPVSEVKQHNIDLLHNFDKFDVADLVNPPDFGAAVLMDSIIDLEKKTGKKLEASLICYRGLITRLLLAGVAKSCQEDAAVQIVKFDGSYFMCTNHKYPKKEEDFKDRDKFDYAGHHFEDIATLEKPFGQSTREDITNRYTSMFKNGAEYMSVTKQKIGNHTVILGAEVDGTSREKNKDNGLEYYYELKTTAAIRDQRQYPGFERKLVKFYMQSALAGIPRLMIGYRDKTFNLSSVETYKIEELHEMSVRAKFLKPEEHWDPNDAWNFFGVFLQMLEDVITEEGVIYDLLFAEGTNYIRLNKAENPTEPLFPGSVGFLPKRFVDWRNSLKDATTN